MMNALIKPLLAAALLTLPGCVLSYRDFAQLRDSTDTQNDRAEAAAETALFAREGLVRYDGPSMVIDLTVESMRRCELREGRSFVAEPGERVTLHLLEVVDGAKPTPVTAVLAAGCEFIQGAPLLEVTTSTGEVRELMRRPRWLAQDRSGGLVEYELIPVTKARHVKVDECEDAMPEIKESVFVRPPATHVLWKTAVRRVAPVTWEEVELVHGC